MSFLQAKEYLKKYNLEERIMEFDKSSATVEEASQAIGCRPEEIAKSLTFIVGDKPIMIVVSGASKIDNAKFKSEFQTKAKMISADCVENLVGHAVGGVCPFGIKENVDVYLDISLKNFDIVYPAAGSSNSAVKLTLKELEDSTNYKRWVDVCKDM